MRRHLSFGNTDIFQIVIAPWSIASKARWSTHQKGQLPMAFDYDQLNLTRAELNFQQYYQRRICFVSWVFNMLVESHIGQRSLMNPFLHFCKVEFIIILDELYFPPQNESIKFLQLLLSIILHERFLVI